MANESEGVLDVLHEWRDMVCYSKGPVHPLCHGAIMNNLDRIEAAWTREREALEAHVRSLQSQLKVAYSCGEQPQGNAAAIYDALESVRNWCINKLGGASFQVTVEGLLQIVDKAMTAPMRNCDKYPIRKTAQIKFEESLPDIVKTEVRNYPFAAMDMFIDWLLANATKKGGAM